jgi:hypothetical protein
METFCAAFGLQATLGATLVKVADALMIWRGSALDDARLYANKLTRRE